MFEESQIMNDGVVTMNIDEMKQPRTMKSHLPVQLLPDSFWRVRPKTIYISRDARDVAVSMFYFAKHMLHRDTPLDDYLETFLKDKTAFSPYREHCLDFWNIPGGEQVLFLTYEWVTANVDEAIENVARFLGKTVDKENFKKLKEHLRFDSMKGES
jgi:hypothetical protein